MPRRSADAPARSSSRSSAHPPAKDCAVCGRTITWRKKWERDWEAVRYCSDACRRRARGAGAREDAALDRALDEALDAGGRDGVTPEEVARAVGGQEWRPLLEPARAAARRLVAAGRAQLVQDGRVVDPSTARGPVRVRRPR
ncbi:DUF3253 domain-containing protein [Kineococcus terrestris]|uniref:DUF3253 domain-containing protein n=1 Tax=Kineococcus terrestris TaxID=2044856 RepID=UPI0034DB0D5D